MTPAGRRRRQLDQIAALVTRGQSERARWLSMEHVADFPDDEAEVARLLATSA